MVLRVKRQSLQIAVIAVYGQKPEEPYKEKLTSESHAMLDYPNPCYLRTKPLCMCT